VHALVRALDAAAFGSISNLVPGVRSLLIELDPLAIDVAQLADRVATITALDRRPAEPVAPGDVERLAEFLARQLGSSSAAPAYAARLLQVPVVYGGEHGPDLLEVAARVGLTPGEVVARHCAVEHTVALLGFAPGFPYLDGLPPELELPRRDTPRHDVPAGSVAIAGRQTGIYPSLSPGGWHLIGRTSIALFDPRQEPPAYFRPGDHVRFVPIQPVGW
jgi:KipI family sensor histidine kinase inhibitor